MTIAIQLKTTIFGLAVDKSGVPAVWDKMQALIENVPPSLAAVEKRLAPGFPGILWERVSNGMLSQVAAFKNEILGGSNIWGGWQSRIG